MEVFCFGIFTDIQSWWEVPSIAHFCSLFRAAFNLLDFDIEDLEEALLTDGTEETSWLQELIVRLLSGCLANNDISTFNYQMFLRRLFRQKCQEHDRYNPFNTDIDFQFLPLRTKVEILQALCDFRLDAEDVLDHLKNLEADSLRVEPLGYDDNESAYWYFYGTRLYREDFTFKNSKKVKAVWQVICFTEDDWYQLARKFRKSSSKAERQLYRTLSENFLPELPRLFQEKEVLHRKRLLEWLPRRTSTRLDIKRQQGNKQADAQEVQQQQQQAQHQAETPEQVSAEPAKTDAPRDKDSEQAEENDTEERGGVRKRHEHRAKRRKENSGSGAGVENKRGKPEVKRHAVEMAERRKRDLRSLNRDKTRKQDAHPGKPEEKAAAPGKGRKDKAGAMPGATTVGRQTNNSLASATGQIVIQSVSNPNRKKLKTSQVFRQTDEDLQTGMYKILQAVKTHPDAWPFAEPVDEEYAPNYYSIIRRPMDLQRMEDKLDTGMYMSYSKFRQDFQLIVDNCRLYNGTDNEYTGMVDKLQKEFERATDRYLDQISSSDEEIAVEFQQTAKGTVPVATGGVAPNAASAQNKRKASGGNTGPKRKPTSMAHAADKRERSPSVEPAAKRRSATPVVLDKVRAEAKGPVQKVARGKTQAAVTKSLKSAKSVAKQPAKRAKKAQRSPSPVRNRTRSPSWPPSSPEPDKVAASGKELRDTNSSDETGVLGKVKGKHKYWKEVFKDKRPVDKEAKVQEPPAARVKDPPPAVPVRAKEPAPKPKDKNIKLKETIEKLKAKSELALSDDGVLRAKNKEDKPREKLARVAEAAKERPDKGVKRPAAPAPRNRPKAARDPGKTRNSRCEYDFAEEGEEERAVEEEENSTTVDEGKRPARKPVGAPGVKKAPVKTVADIDALSAATEQTLKDINKWLDDTPRFSEFSSASNSPSHFIPAEEQDPVGAKIELEYRKTLRMDKPAVAQRPAKEAAAKDAVKRRASKDPAKLHRRREVQRTIERLQPGKSKGNLLSNMQNANKPEELFALGPLAKLRESKNSLVVKQDESAPKLSLGTVLDSFGQQHNFSEDTAEAARDTVDSASVKDESTSCSASAKLEAPAEVRAEEAAPGREEVADSRKPEPVPPEKKEAKSENKATPNLSAWFKAFGAPKVQPAVKRKPEAEEEKKEPADAAASDGVARVPPANSVPVDSKPAVAAVVAGEDTGRKVVSPEPESPAAGGQPTPRQRRGSTGSSISERSSFSQDLDSSPRMTIDERIGTYPAPYPSPLHRSPASASPVMASPRPDEPPRPYPTLNGSIRVGFYQDTVSTKSSPDKSCSPRDAPHSPYQHYAVAEHVYTPPNAAIQGGGPPGTGAGFAYSNPPYYGQSAPPAYAASATNHSPPVYGDRPAPAATYYDTNKPLTDQYNAKVPAPNLGFQGPEQPVDAAQPVNAGTGAGEFRPQIRVPDNKAAMFPVKKRLYSENELPMCREEQELVLEQQLGHEGGREAGAAYATNRSLEMGLMTGRQLNLGAQVAGPRQLGIGGPAQGSPALQELRPNSRGETQKAYMAPAAPLDQQLQPQQRSLADAQAPVYSRPALSGQMDLGQAHLHGAAGGMAHHHHHQAGGRELELGMQLPPGNQALRPMSYPTTTASAYTHTLAAHESSGGAYSLNMSVNPHRGLDMQANAAREPDERKLTNMGYLAPNAASPQTYQSLNYTNRPPSRPPAPGDPSNAVPPAAAAEHMNLSMRYPDGRVAMPMNYHRAGGDAGQANLPQAEMLQVNRATPNMPPANYKPEMSIPRPPFNAAAGLGMDQSLGLRGNLANLSHIVDRYPGSDERLLTGLQTAAPYYTADKAHMFAAAAKGIPTSSAGVTASLPMFSQANLVGMSSYGQSPAQAVYTRTMSDLQSPSTKNQQQQQAALQQQQQQHHQQQQQLQQQQQQAQVQQQQQLQQQQQQQQQQVEKKPSKKRKTKQQQQQQAASAASEGPMSNASGVPPAQQGFQAYAELKNAAVSGEPSAISLKTVPGSAFNFGPTPTGLGLPTGLYGDKDGYPGFLDDYRPATNYYMAAAAVAHRGTAPPESNVVDKPAVRPAHQQSAAPSPAAAAAFPFLGHPQPRAPAYPSLPSPFINPHHQPPLMDPNSPLYQQYLHSAAAGAVLHQGLLAPPTGYPPGYHPALSSMRQPYDSMTRPSWL